MVKVKICGITNMEDALIAAKLGADAVGFVFYPKSPRYIPPNRAAEIIDVIPPFVSAVGVFVDPSLDELADVIERCRLDYIQLHGLEPPQFCREVSLLFSRKVIKAFRIKDESSLQRLRIYDVDAYLLDAYRSGSPGGTGLTFRWEVAYNLDVDRVRLILAGGLNPENVRNAIQIVRPWAVDVSSGVEIKPGKKDPDKIKRFIAAVKGGD